MKITIAPASLPTPAPSLFDQLFRQRADRKCNQQDSTNYGARRIPTVQYRSEYEAVPNHDIEALRQASASNTTLISNYPPSPVVLEKREADTKFSKNNNDDSKKLTKKQKTDVVEESDESESESDSDIDSDKEELDGRTFSRHSKKQKREYDDLCWDEDGDDTWKFGREHLGMESGILDWNFLNVQCSESDRKEEGDENLSELTKWERESARKWSREMLKVSVLAGHISKEDAGWEDGEFDTLDELLEG